MTRRKRDRRDRRHDNPGRPVSVGGDTAAVNLTLRVPETLRDDAARAAGAAGVSPSQWWRLAALAALGRHVTFSGHGE